MQLRHDRRGEYDLWQRRFWEHLIRDDEDFAAHVAYIHHNPVKHGLVTDPFAWRWSSIHAHARRGDIGRDACVCRAGPVIPMAAGAIGGRPSGRAGGGRSSPR